MSSTSTAARAPYVLRREDGDYSIVSHETLLAAMLLYAEARRRKPGLFRRSGERIRVVAQAYYRYSVVSVSERFAAVIDHVQPKRYSFEYAEPLLDELEGRVAGLRGLPDKGFIDALINIKNILREIDAGKRVRRKEIVLQGLVSDKGALDDLVVLFTHSPYDGVEGPSLPERTVDPASVASTITRVLEDIEEKTGRLNRFIAEIEEAASEWRNSVEERYEEERRRLEEEVARIREEVRARIAELREKRESEKRSVEERYRALMDSVERKLRETRRRYGEKKAELEKAARYGGDTRAVKKELSSIEKRLRELEEELSRLKKKLEEELRRIDEKYDRLEEAERRKLSAAEARLAGLGRERERLIEHAERLLDEIRRLIYSISSGLEEARRSIEEHLIPIPPHGSGGYEIPVLFTIYISRGEERATVAPPIYIDVRRGLLRRSQLVEFAGLHASYSELSSFLGISGFRNKLEEYNVLRNISPERLEQGLHDLVRDGVIDEDEAEEVADSIRVQVEMLSRTSG